MANVPGAEGEASPEGGDGVLGQGAGGRRTRRGLGPRQLREGDPGTWEIPIYRSER